jgi:tetratricopeptide (TPR) repeat protein
MRIYMQKILFLTGWMISMICCEVLANPDDQFSKANTLYRSGSYKEAVNTYESLISAGYTSSALYYNLGNAYFKTNNIPKSILNYERALKLKPGDEDILFNLRLANQHTVDKIEPLPRLFYQQWWDNFVSMYNEDIWGKAGIALIWVSLLFGALYIFSNTVFLKKSGFFATVLFLVAGSFMLVTGWVQHSRFHNHRSAIITETSAYIKSSPDDKSTSLFMLHSGTKIDIVDELTGWKKIRIANGNIGWINEKDIEVI